MHEFHLMREVIAMVDRVVRESGGRRATVIRLAVGAWSHLGDDAAALQTAFEFAARGTTAEGARLDIMSVPATARCSTCQAVSSVDTSDPPVVCPRCRAPLPFRAEPTDVRLQDVVVEG